VKSHNVRFWEIRPRKTAAGSSWTVRWTFASREKSATFARKAQAAPVAADAGCRPGRSIRR
jgi:hypothetical protein